MNLFPIYLVMP